jgi:hypothetical protein
MIVMVMMIMMGHECKRGLPGRAISKNGGEEMSGYWGLKIKVCYIHRYRYIKPTEYCLKSRAGRRLRECNRG